MGSDRFTTRIQANAVTDSDKRHDAGCLKVHSSQSPAQRATALQIILRNASVWTAAMLAFCVIDYFYVRNGPSTVFWAERMFLPAWFSATLWANKDLFRQRALGAERWFAVGVTSLLIMLCTGYVLATLGIWFHLSIGGTL